MGYKEDLKIDQHSLDIEWQNQALKYAEWGEKAVDAAYDRDKAKEQLEITRAQVDAKIRASYAASGEKITEAAISNKITLDGEYQEANQKYIDSVRQLGIMNVARDSFDHRKKALEKLTDLFLSNYWADRPMKKENKEAMEKISGDGLNESFKESMEVKRRKKNEKT